MVEECVYNQSLHCTASAIMVKTIGNDIVGTSRGTMCDTFSFRSPDHKPDHS
ncbi:MAG: DUF1540 domain-containing protein [Firmicutes bacterium]|nr:DUF1540 domain-containing protein [Bacillota bacterium]